MSEAINQGRKIHYYNCIELRKRGREEGRMHRWIKKRNKMSGTGGGRATRDGEVKEWKGKDEGCGEGGRASADGSY